MELWTVVWLSVDVDIPADRPDRDAADCLVSLWIWPWRVLAPCGPWNAHHGDAREQKPQSAVEILKQRYARGEITKEEYQDENRH